MTLTGLPLTASPSALNPALAMSIPAARTGHRSSCHATHIAGGEQHGPIAATGLVDASDVVIDHVAGELTRRDDIELDDMQRRLHGGARRVSRLELLELAAGQTVDR